MKRTFILISAVLFITPSIAFFASCKKDKNVIKISGTVYDPNTKAYVQGAHVNISASKITSGFYNPNYSDIASTTTDANGAFSFEFDKDKTAGYRFYISKDNYFDNTTDVPDDDIVAGETYTPTFNIYPEAYIKLHVKNSAPYNSTDFIAYSYESNLVQCAGCCTNNTFKGYGTGYDTLFSCKAYGNQNVKINWHVTKVGTDVAYSDTIFVTAFDTTQYQLFY
jgi:hypothetical protein